jgi:hypothetical protein
MSSSSTRMRHTATTIVVSDQHRVLLMQRASVHRRPDLPNRAWSCRSSPYLGIRTPGLYSPLVIRSSRIALNCRQVGPVTAAPDSGPPTARAIRESAAAPRGESVRRAALAPRSTAAAPHGRASRVWLSATGAAAPRAHWRSVRSERRSGPSHRGSARVPRCEADRGHLVRPDRVPGPGRSW